MLKVAPDGDLTPPVPPALPALPALPVVPVLPAASVVSVLTALRPLLDANTAHPDPLTTVLHLVAGMVPDVRGATLTRRRRSGHTALLTVAATDSRFETIDTAQFRSGSGPIAEAMNHDTTVTTVDLARDKRWPALHHRLAGSGPLAAISIPVRDDHRRITVFTLYSASPLGPAGRELIPAAVAVLEVAMVALGQHQRVADLRLATVSNRRIGIAVGMVMAYDRSTPEQAFDTIAATSQALSRKVVDLAEDIILAGALPKYPGPPTHEVARVAAADSPD